MAPPTLRSYMNSYIRLYNNQLSIATQVLGRNSQHRSPRPSNKDQAETAEMATKHHTKYHMKYHTRYHTRYYSRYHTRYYMRYQARYHTTYHTTYHTRYHTTYHTKYYTHPEWQLKTLMGQDIRYQEPTRRKELIHLIPRWLQ